ncbi:ead/Ea22-like family protein [Klebsiella michiganensis]|uniref:ead/Ea22-like family protein n=1 Tax=Klebsiella michiganensis TaxID=1134687 RepID=UPI0027FBC374|nr:ead/Ea22-like family protein [Klebsiella michiganensis]MDQ7851912.1 ead/Ea22-like family protein [Klebsiella michiganensis]
MTTDITELAQRMKAAAEKATPGNWRAFQYHDGRCGVGGGNHDEIMVCEHISKKRPHDAVFIALANPANALALVEALEKAQADGNEYAASERAVAVKSVELQDEIYGLKARIADLEESNAQVIQSRDHYKRMTEEGLKQLAESRTVTVKPMRPGHITVGGEKLGIYMRDEVDEFLAALTAAGIKWEAE